MGNILEVNNLCKTYSEFKLNNVGFSLEKGCILGLIGANGAGKSTTLKLILNLIKRENGSVKVFGLDNIKDEEKIKEQLGIVFDESYFHDTLKPTQICKIMSHIYKEWDSNTYYSYLDRFKVSKNKLVKELSRGMKMKLSIAVALSHNAKLLIFDEPTSGLDPIVRSEILDVFLDYIQDEEKSIILSTHITSDLEKIADYITLIDNGNLILNQSKDELLYNYGILKGGKSQLDSVDKSDLIRLRKGQFGFEALVKDTDKIKKKYPDLVVDKVDIEDIMLFFNKED